MRKYIIFILSLVTISLSAQSFRVKGLVGTTRYAGDLAPYSFLSPSSEDHFSIGLMFGVKPIDFLSFDVKYFAGKISGNDALATTKERRLRNLRFKSPVTEYGIGAELDINNLIFGGASKYGIHVYLTSGFNIFTFNPRTDNNGIIYFLQEEGTEGQGLEGYSDPYSLTQYNVSLGFGLEFRLTKNFNLGIEVSRRITNTDYLDDVSGAYPDFDLLAEIRGQEVVDLSYRTPEIKDNVSLPVIGSMRGNPNNKDWYIFTGVFLTYYLNDNPIKIPKKKKAPKEPFSNQ